MRGMGEKSGCPNVPILVWTAIAKIPGQYEFYGCFWHGHTCQPYRDVSTMSGETLADRYERKITRLEQITQAGYEVRTHWECEFDKAGKMSELRTHPIVEKSPLKTRDALYGGRTEAMRLHHKAREDETVQYVDVISLYPYICKYFKYFKVIPSSMSETRA